MSKLAMISVLLFVSASAFSQTKTVEIEIHNAVKNGGTVYISVSQTAEAYKNRTPDKVFRATPTESIVRKEVTLPMGNCVINAFQDRNANEKCDSNFFGMPKEPVGISRWDGSGIPGNFEKHKVRIDEKTQKITVNLYEL
ncbi:MAG: DUF2141 domain-containing protein [Bacteroidales bacterium]|jgi:uncharacterized protein (DUF2141 family)|nr:DUF2141 domain-containing protein [Bacteroidales bacterium]